MDAGGSALSVGWQRTQELLFRPFNLGTWFGLGVIFFLEQLLEGFGGYNTFRSPGFGQAHYLGKCGKWVGHFGGGEPFGLQPETGQHSRAEDALFNGRRFKLARFVTEVKLGLYIRSCVHQPVLANARRLILDELLHMVAAHAVFRNHFHHQVGSSV